jgi:iron complex outermembrane receptor protein
VRGALLFLATTFAAPPAWPAEGTETVVVTGVRSGQDDLSSVAPVTNIGAADIAKTGSTTLENLLQSMPSFGYQGVGAMNSNGFGVFFVDLRSLNFNRTLTLVDGTRFVLSGIKTDEAVDLNNVPIGLIDHIEVLRSGSEPIYGADAVAGVVNVVLKKDFDGFNVTTYTGVTNYGDDLTGEVTATWGKNFPRGNITINVGYFTRGALAQDDHSWSRNPITSATIDPNGHIEAIVGIPASAGGHAISADGTIDDQILGPGAARPFDPATDSYNFAKEQDLQGVLKRQTANLIATYELAPTVTASLEVLFSNREADSQLAPQTLGLSGTAKYPEGFVVPASNAFNFFSQDVELQRTLTEAGPLEPRADEMTYRIVAALRGQIFRTADWTLSYDHGNSATEYDILNSINLTHAIESLDPATCEALPGCVTADFFGPGSLTPSAVHWLRYTDVAHSDYGEDVAQASLHVPLFDLGAGSVVATAGGEYRWETGYTHVSAVTLAGDQATPDSASTNGKYSTREGYLDIAWPLLRGLPLVKSLDADTAARYSDYDLFGSFATWKTSLSYAPDDQLRLRGTLGVARRAPAITEAFGGLAANFVAVQDPCDSHAGESSNPVVAANCAAVGLPSNFVQTSPLINIASGGGCLTAATCHIVPETSRSFTLGAVLTPDFLPDFSATIDYYRYKVSDAIDSLADTDANFIPDSCYESVNLSSSLCPLIERTPSGPNAGQINRILGLDENVGTIETDGIEGDLTYQHEWGRGWSVSVDWKANLLFSYRIDEEGETSQYAGKFASLANVGSYTHFKSLAVTTLRKQDWLIGWRINYIGGASVLGQNPTQTPFASAPAVWYHDLVLSYVQDTTTYTVGVDNIFNRKPPILLDGISNTNLNTYDPDGMFFYVRMIHAF